MIPALALWAACGSGPAPLPDDVAWFAPGPPLEAEACADEPPPPDGPAVRVRVALRVAEGVDLDRVETETRAAARWWAAHGLTLVPDGPVARVDAGPVLVGSPAEARAALAPDAPADALRTLVAPLRERVAALTRPPEGRVVVAVLPRLAADDSWAARAFRQLQGLTLSPHLEATNDDGDALVGALALHAPHDPIVWLSDADLAARPPWHPPLTLAHELGHAFGLPHATDPDNLMLARTGRCVPGLTPAQLALVRRHATALTTPAESP